MKDIWDAYAALYTWNTGIPIAFNAAIAIAFIDYTSSSQLKRSLNRGGIGFVLAYVLLMGSELNIYLRAWILALIIGVIFGIILMNLLWNYKDKDERKYASMSLGLISFVILGLIFNGAFLVGFSFFFNLHYFLYLTALIGLPTLSIAAAIFISSKLNRPGVPFTVFCYLTFSAWGALMYFLSSTTVHSQGLNPNALEIVEQARSFSRYVTSYLTPFLFLIGPFLLMIIVFHFRQTIGTWVGCICGLFAVTLIQLIMFRYTLFDKIRDVFRTSNLTWIFVIYAVSTVSLVSYYLRTLYRKKTDRGVKNLHPFLAIGAVVFNICFLYPIIVSSHRWLWGAWFAGINLLIGLIILFGRLKVLTRQYNGMDIL